jgi:DNA-binding transcriptional regulator GbsR (MarR family)
MKLTPVMEKYILHWGEMGSRWGVNRSVAQIQALLYLSPEPLPAEDISELLGIARSNVSNSLKELQNWDLIQIAHVMGDRRDHFQSGKDVWEMVTAIMDGRKRREIDPTISFLKDITNEMAKDKHTPKEVKERIESMLEFTEEVGGWYEKIKVLPRSTLLKIIRMGSKLSKVVNG